jgi:hypothetical protein
MLKKAVKFLSKLTGQAGGVDLIQLLIALIIIGIAAVSATFSVFVARGNLDAEWRKKRALEIARDEVEYWSAFIFEGQGGVSVPEFLRTRTITREDTIGFWQGNSEDPVICKVIRDPLEIDEYLKGSMGMECYKIKVSVVWDERSDNPNVVLPADTVKLEAWMINDISG